MGSVQGTQKGATKNEAPAPKEDAKPQTSKAQDKCERCEQVGGHKTDCPRRYRDCWTYGIKKPEKKDGDEKESKEFDK